MDTDRILPQEITGLIIKSFYDVYNELGHGFLESVYENALEIVFKENGLHVERQKGIEVSFRGHVIGEYKADVLVNNQVIVEIKAAGNINNAHQAQIINYLKATHIEVGLLLNFGNKPEFKRFLYDNNRKTIREYPYKSVADQGGGIMENFEYNRKSSG